MSVGIYISDVERDALSRLAYAEARFVTSVPETLRYGSIVDSVINRVAADRSTFGHSILEVINKPSQYSPLPRGGTWEDLDPAPASVRAVVDAHINARLNGSPSLVGLATHYINPTAPGYADAWWNGWGHKMTETKVIGHAVFDSEGNLLDNYQTHVFGNLFGDLVPEDYMLIEGAMPGTLFEVEFPHTLQFGYSVRPEPHINQCFLAGTAISMWDGTKKPIEQVQPGDMVTSYDKDGTLKPGKVKRTMTNRAKQILDVHGLMVTPGHATLCGDGLFAGRHVPILDILRSDGALVLENGNMIRAATGCPLGSLGDRMVTAIVGQDQPGGRVKIAQLGQIRLGTRFIMPSGEDVSVLDLIAQGGGSVTSDGMITTRDGGPEMPFRWTLTPLLPRPEDYVLQRSATHLHDIYQANEWESVRPAMPVPTFGEAGPTTSTHPLQRRAAPVNVPLSMLGHPSAPKPSREYRRMAEAKPRQSVR